ncbi:hypothetical protein EJB05_14470, partial [Eragrostis curvula]
MQGINNKVEIIGNPDSTGALAVTSHLKIVKVQCEVFDNIVGQVSVFGKDKCKSQGQRRRQTLFVMPLDTNDVPYTGTSLHGGRVYICDLGLGGSPVAIVRLDKTHCRFG